jgi:predicted ester cyclase
MSTPHRPLDPRSLGPCFFQEQDRLRGGPAEELCAPEYRATINGNPPMPLAGHQAFARAFYEAFPDVFHEIEDVVGDAERVAVRFVLHGTHRGPFFGLPPTERKIAVPATAILRVVNGRVTELRAVFDQLGLLQQLGAAPSGG